MRGRAPLHVIVALATASCAPAVRPGQTTSTALSADPQRRVRVEPNTSGAHLVPIEAPEGKGIGVEPGGGTRAILAGVRIVSLLGGAIVAADDALPGNRWDVIPLPERLGGGFLFKIEDKSIWRAEKWLGPARPIYTSSAGIARIVPGLDRVYVLAGAWHAIDGTTGESKPLGPWPASPTVSAYAAADGWRALAIADLRGVVSTNDAGATWRRVTLPIEPRELSVRGDALEVRGLEPGRTEAAYEVRPDGQTVRVAPLSPSSSGGATLETASDASGPLGPHALLAAVEDGWPLEDGTALVARDGVLSRVRLEDGAVVESAVGAFALRPSRCHPILLGGPGHVGFVCGEPRGATIVYAFDAPGGRLAEVRRFEQPRAVVASGNGAIAVRGRCDVSPEGDADPDARYYCLRTTDGAWREIRIEGAIGGERVVVLADGRFAVVSPPQQGRASGTLTLVDGERARSVPMVFPPIGADVARMLSVGVWLDGIEERRPGTLGGWIEAAGTMLGFELELDGNVRLGDLVRGEATLPMVSGRYGLGWSMAHGGFETTDGGMRWMPISVPEPIKPLREVGSRACGPVGCSAAGWLRVGWGKGPSATAAASSPRPPRYTPWTRTSSALSLECDAGTSTQKPRSVTPDPLGAPPEAAAAKDARMVTYDAQDTLERAPRSAPVARIYAWGPRSADWDRSAKWEVRWEWPFGGAGDVRSSTAVAAPPIVLDAARSSAAISILPSLFLGLAVGDDPSHALLVARRGPHSEAALFELEADHAPVEIKRGDGEPLGEVESAVRASGRWYLATSPAPARQGERVEEVIWQVDGPTVRELARVPRVGAPDGRVSPARLATRGDGRTLGLVVDGQPWAERAVPTRWVAAIDIDTGAVGEIELLGAFYFGEERPVSLCAGDDAGWSLDLPLEGAASFPILVSAQGSTPAALHGAFARVHFGRSSGGAVCVERLSGSLAPTVDSSPRTTTTSPSPASITVAVTGESDGKARRVFRCGVR